MKRSEWETQFLFLEWGFISFSVFLLTSFNTYHPSMGIGVGLFVGSNLARWIRIGKFSRATPIDIGILAFTLSAFIAFLVSPAQAAATHRLFLYLASFSIYYSIVNSRSRILHILTLFVVIGATVGAIIFISQNHWPSAPTRFGITRFIGILIYRLTPNLGLPQPYWHVIRNWLASTLGIILPVAIFFAIRGKINRRKFRPAFYTSSKVINFYIFGSAVLLVAILLTESRSPWMVWIGLAALMGFWEIAGRIGRRYKLSSLMIFWSCMVAAVALGLFSFIYLPQVRGLLEFVPGPNTAIAREEIYTQSWLLAQDTPFTGGGLAAYPMLYSTYIRVSPYTVFLSEDTGNNIYLNLLVEQGWLGLLAFITLFLTGLFIATKRIDLVHKPYRRFVIIGIFGTGFILLQGFIHATFISTRIIPFLLIPMGCALAGTEIRSTGRPPSLFNVWKTQLVLMVLFGTPLIITIIRSPSSTIASWYANQGAVRMARADLENFPAGEWDDGSRASNEMPGEDLFERSLTLYPNGRTAHHRLGLISMLRRNYESASDHLELAINISPEHQGIKKNLGYSYTWQGNYAQALPLLQQIAEVPEEIEIYEWWWQTQNRLDFASNAEEMKNLLLNQ